MTAEPITVISSGGHVGPETEEYRDYVEPRYRDAFERFLVPYGYRSASQRSLETSQDQSSIDEWAEIMLDTGRWENFHRRKRRLAEAEREDVAAEVLLRAVPFLAEPAASFVTGESVGVWGGSFMF